MTWTVLHDACEHQDTKTMIARSKCNADEAHNLDDHGSTPLHIACWNNPPLDAVRALMGAHPQGLASKDVHGDTPLHIAVSNPATSVELVRALVEECPEATNIVNREGLMPLHSACRYSPMNDEIISIILEANVPAAKHRIKIGDLVSRKKFPDQQQQQLHHILASSPAAIDLRFEALGIQTRDGSYPLHMAVSNRSSLEVIELLITAAPEVVHLINKYGETPLHLALRGRVAEEKVIEMLLDADDNALALEMPERFCGNLPLHLAVVDGASLSIVVQLLTRFPHAVRVPNTDGDLPISLARGDEDLMDLLVVSDLADDLDDVETAASKMTDFDDEITDVDVDIVEVQSSVCSEDSSAG